MSNKNTTEILNQTIIGHRVLSLVDKLAIEFEQGWRLERRTVEGWRPILDHYDGTTRREAIAGYMAVTRQLELISSVEFRVLRPDGTVDIGTGPVSS